MEQTAVKNEEEYIQGPTETKGKPFPLTINVIRERNYAVNRTDVRWCSETSSPAYKTNVNRTKQTTSRLKLGKKIQIEPL